MYIENNILTHFMSYHLYLFIAILYGYTKLVYASNNKNIIKSIYFFAHFVFNMFCVYNSYPYVLDLLKYPLNFIEKQNTLSFYVVLFHIYHIILTRQIQIDEWIHHILVFIINPLLWIKYNNICEMGMFFTTGLPGGITYLLLCLKNFNLIQSITEKNISKHLNLWIRAPGCILTSYIIFLNYVNNNFGYNLGLLHTIAIFSTIASCFWNGMYFLNTIITSCAKLQFS